MRPNCNFNFAVTEGASALVGVAVFIDIDAAVHVAALEQNADKFFIFPRFHAAHAWNPNFPVAALILNYHDTLTALKISFWIP
jgi:hypothetical protein